MKLSSLDYQLPTITKFNDLHLRDEDLIVKKCSDSFIYTCSQEPNEKGLYDVERWKVIDRSLVLRVGICRVERSVFEYLFGDKNKEMRP